MAEATNHLSDKQIDSLFERRMSMESSNGSVSTWLYDEAQIRTFLSHFSFWLMSVNNNLQFSLNLNRLYTTYRRHSAQDISPRTRFCSRSRSLSSEEGPGELSFPFGSEVGESSISLD